MNDWLLVDDGAVCELTVATTWSQRSRGLLGRNGIEGAMWLSRTSSVHTFGMRFAIDVVHCDRAGRVLGVVTQQPGRLGAPRWRARNVIELGAGRAAELGITRGAVLARGTELATLATLPTLPTLPDRGGTTAEYVGIIAVVSLTISALLLTPVGGALRHGLATAVCTVIGRGQCDSGTFADGTTDPGAVANREPQRCVSRTDETDLDLEVGLGRFVFVGGTGRLLRETRSDGSVAITLLDDLSGGGGVGGEAGLEVQGSGVPVSAFAQADVRFGGGGSWEFADATQADAFEQWAIRHLAGDPVTGLLASQLTGMLGAESDAAPAPRRLEIRAGTDLSAALAVLGSAETSFILDVIDRIETQIGVRLDVSTTLGVTVDLDARTVTAHLDGDLSGGFIAGLATKGAIDGAVDAAVGGGVEVDRSVGLVYGFDTVLQRLEVDLAAPVDTAEAGRLVRAGSVGELVGVLGAGGHVGGSDDVIGQVHVALDLGDRSNRLAFDAAVHAAVHALTAGGRDPEIDAALGELAFRINADGRVSATTVARADQTVFRFGVVVASAAADRRSGDVTAAYYLDRSRGGLVRWRECLR